MANPAWKKGVSGNLKGRPVGKGDWRTRWYDVKAKLEERGFDPISALIDMATNLEYDPIIRFGATKELASRICPHLKSVEVKIDSDDETKENIIELQTFKTQLLELIDSNKNEY